MDNPHGVGRERGRTRSLERENGEKDGDFREGYEEVRIERSDERGKEQRQDEIKRIEALEREIKKLERCREERTEEQQQAGRREETKERVTGIEARGGGKGTVRKIESMAAIEVIGGEEYEGSIEEYSGSEEGTKESETGIRRKVTGVKEDRESGVEPNFWTLMRRRMEKEMEKETKTRKKGRTTEEEKKEERRGYKYGSEEVKEWRKRRIIWEGVMGENESERKKAVESMTERILRREKRVRSIEERKNDWGRYLQLVIAEMRDSEDREKILEKKEVIWKRWEVIVREDMSYEERELKWRIVRKEREEREKGRLVEIGDKRIWIDNEEWTWRGREQGWRKKTEKRD